MYDNGNMFVRGNVGIGLTNPGAKLQVAGTVATDSALADIDAYRIIKPNGGARSTSNSSETGAIKITYPVSWTNTMHRIKLNVYEYSTNKAFTIYFGGYNYAPGPAWYNVFAYTLSNPGIDRNFTVRFGHDGTKMVVYIGELANGWTYPQIFIEEVELGYGGHSSTWRDGAWSIGFEASAFQNVTQTITDSQATNWARNGTSLYYNTGYVGINTTTPAVPLELAYGGPQLSGTAYYTSRFLQDKTNYRGVFLGYDTSATIGMIGAESAGPASNLAFWTYTGAAWGERMRINGAGNVGIGSASPGYKLDVVGNARIGANTVQQAHAALQVSAGEGSVTTYRDIDLKGNWAGGEGHAITAMYSTSANNIVGQMVFEHNGPGSRIKFGRLYDSGDQSTYPFHMVSNGSAGRLGIGTSVPTAPLDTLGVRVGRDFSIANRATVRLDANTADYPADILFGHTAAANQTSWDGVHWSLSSRANDASNKFYIYRAAGNPGGSGEEVIMALQPNGNVGIGTTGPVEKLDVNGGIVVRGGNFIWFGVTTTLGSWATRQYQNSGTHIFNVNGFEINNVGYGSATWFYINSGGNVGLGTTSPGGRLEVNHTAAQGATAVILQSSNSGGNATIRWRNSGGTDQAAIGSNYNVSDNGALEFINGGTTNVIIRSGGNVGIGTTNPTAKLMVQTTGDVPYITMNTTATGDKRVRLQFTQGGNSGMEIGTDYSTNNGNNFYFYDRVNAQTLGFISAGTTWFNANVGVGTSSPAAPLAIAAGEGTYNATNFGSSNLGAINIRSETSDRRNAITFSSAGQNNAQAGIYVHQDNSLGTHMYLATTGNYGTGPQARLTVRNDGNVGIGSTVPAYALDVAGTIRATGDVIAYSDARVKENVLTLENSLELVKKLRGVSYNKIGESEKKVGVIAQEVLEVLPEVVSQDSEGTYSVAYGNITAVLIEAIKQQQLQIDELKAEIKQLKG
jgi:hypothetical protein